MRFAAMTTFIPIHLWEGLQEICFRADLEFLQDASRITGIPLKELRSKITGTRGVPAIIPEANGPWWMDSCCPVMDRIGFLMRRCTGKALANGYCWEHKDGGIHYDDPQIQNDRLAKPFRYNGCLYWVNEDHSVLNAYGMPVSEFQVDLKSKLVYYNNASPATTGSRQETTQGFDSLVFNKS